MLKILKLKLLNNNKIIERFRRRLLEESGQLPRRVVPKPEEENSN